MLACHLFVAEMYVCIEMENINQYAAAKEDTKKKRREDKKENDDENKKKEKDKQRDR